MATLALPRPIPPHRPTATFDVTPITPPRSLDDVSSPAVSPTTPSVPIPNKRIPTCPPGSAPSGNNVQTPPQSPKSAQASVQHSILSPPDGFPRMGDETACWYELDCATVAQAIEHTSRQPLPDPSLVFPWLHGLHPQNQLQRAFFDARRRLQNTPPTCFRGVTIVKANGCLDFGRLKGAISPREFMHFEPIPDFDDADPLEGFSVRNFQIQAAKTAMLSDIIVYGDGDVEDIEKVGHDIAVAQSRRRKMLAAHGIPAPTYNTFICTSPFEEFERNHPSIVAVDSLGNLTGNVVDLCCQERREMWIMAEPSVIAPNVYLGPSPEMNSPEEQQYDVLIECSDSAKLNANGLRSSAMASNQDVYQSFHEFPSSGSFVPSANSLHEADGILETCQWIYHLANGTRPGPEHGGSTDCSDDEAGTNGLELSTQAQAVPRKVLIHCADGYTESTFLAIAYCSYAGGLPVHDAWLHLHTDMQRNFFAYPVDVSVLTSLSTRLLCESPASREKSLIEITEMVKHEPRWLARMDGSLPSRVLDYLYLGNLQHANNPDLLKALGICQILSVGEMASWHDEDLKAWGPDNVCVVQGVQDNGIDPLTDEFARCLDFIDRGRQKGTATLVHCRVGVSRSATICIAEVMRAFNMSFPRAYCFVRARRLNVIIQPHLRFAYELLKWEETLAQRGHAQAPIKREMEWAEIAREIALMNKPYAR